MEEQNFRQEHESNHARRPQDTAISWRILIIALMLLAIIFGVRPILEPATLPVNETAGGFQVARAIEDLQVIASQPRSPGSASLLSAQEYILTELQALNLEVEFVDATYINQYPNTHAVTAARGHNLLARLKGSNTTGAVLIAGHLDSASTTTGASDCGGCAAAVLELARVLSAGAQQPNDIIFLIEDGEETTRSGARAFVANHPWAKDVRVTINLEAVGTHGASSLYVTGPENGWVIREALRAMPRPVAYSLVNDLVWLSGTGGSDLDQFLQISPVGVGLVYTGNVPAYHTRLDNLENLDPRSLQQQGENALAMTRHFASLPLSGKLRSPNWVYFNLFEHVLVAYPAWVGILLALLAAVGYAYLLWLGIKQKHLKTRYVLVGFQIFIPLVLAAALICAGLWYLLRLLDPRLQVYMVGISYDREWYTLAFALLAAGLAGYGFSFQKRASRAEIGMGVLAWWVVIALLTSLLQPGISYIFTLTSLFTMLIEIPRILAWSHTRPQRLIVSAIAASGIMLIAAPVINILGIYSGRAELLTSFPMIALLPALCSAPLAGLLLPVNKLLSGRHKSLISGFLAGSALLILVGVTLSAAFTAERPKPNMVAYVQEPDQSYWVTLGANVGSSRAALLDDWTRQFFGPTREQILFSPSGAFDPTLQYPAYRAPAERSNWQAAQVEVLADQLADDGLRYVRLHLVSPSNAPTILLTVQSKGKIVSARLWDQPMNQTITRELPTTKIKFDLYAIGPEGALLEFVLEENSLTLDVEEHIYALPEVPGTIIQPRPDWMMPSPTLITDTTLLRQFLVIKDGAAIQAEP